jgi:hypothetical protein
MAVFYSHTVNWGKLNCVKNLNANFVQWEIYHWCLNWPMIYNHIR